MKLEKKQISEAFKTNAKDLPEISKLCKEIGIDTVADLDNFMMEPENKGKQVLDALRDWRQQLGPDFKIEENLLKEGIERTYFMNSPEYKKLTKVAEMLNKASGTDLYYVRDTYLDYGQDWKWTTIIKRRTPESKWDNGYQVLNPRDYKLILTDDEEGIRNVFEQEKLTYVLSESIVENTKYYYGYCGGAAEDFFDNSFFLIVFDADAQLYKVEFPGEDFVTDKKYYSSVAKAFAAAKNALTPDDGSELIINKDAAIILNRINNGNIEEGFTAKDFTKKLDLYNDLLAHVRVNSPQSRGAVMPEFSKTSINPSKFADGMRPKYYDFSDVTSDAATFRWITQEDFTKADAVQFFAEVKRAINALAKLFNYTKSFTLKVEVTSRDGEEYGSATKELTFKAINESLDNKSFEAEAVTKNGDIIYVSNTDASITYIDLTIEDVPYGSKHDYDYYEEPYYDTKDVSVGDFEYKIDVNDIIDFIYESLSEEDFKKITDIDSEEEVDNYIIQNLQMLLDRMKEDIVSKYEDDAKEAAYDTALELADEEPDYDDYDEKLHESIDVETESNKQIIINTFTEKDISYKEIDNKIVTKYDRAVLSIISQALTANDFNLVDFDSTEKEELFVYSQDVVLPETNEKENRGKIFVTVYDNEIVIMFTVQQLESVKLRESEEQEDIEQYDDVELPEDNNLQLDDSKYYVTEYNLYPIYEPAEGGYYYTGVEIVAYNECDSLEEARKEFERIAAENNLVIKGLNKDFAESQPTGYIGDGEFIQIESNSDDLFDKVGSRESGRQLYQ